MTNNMSNDWTDKLRDQLADYQEPVKDDLWAAIEQSLAQQASPQADSSGGEFFQETSMKSEKPARQVLLRRFSMAAAIAVLAVGGTYVYLQSQHEGELPVRDLAVVQPQAHAAVSVSHASSQEETEVGTSTAVTSIDRSLMASAKNAVAEFWAAKPQGEGQAVASDAEVETAVLASMEGSAPLEVEGKPAEKTVSQQENQQKKPRQKNGDAKLVAYNPLESVSAQDVVLHGKSRRSSGWSMQVYGENGLVGNSMSNGNSPMLASDMPSPESFPTDGDHEYANVFDTKLASGFMANDYAEEVKHHQPLSVGLQVGFGLASRLRLTMGVVYTKTSSDFVNTAGVAKHVTTQDLHYIGIPVNLCYRVWGTRNLHTYMTVGGEGAVNVKNHTESDGQETSSQRDRMQWSGNVSAGVQYDFIPQLGIYVEPGMKYYFDNGSQIENVFKDKKCNFNFQFGLRWNIGK